MSNTEAQTALPEIRKGVEKPARVGGGGGGRRSGLWEVLESMEVGDSFETSNSGIGSYLAVMNKAEDERKFSTRTIERDEDGKPTLTGVWRDA